jgi:hypothetical protein
LIQVKDAIQLNPAWQRGAVWSDTKQALLIDSILRGYDIPKIYLRKCSESAPYSYEVVDGQQRLRSLWRYIDDEYCLSNNSEKIGRNVISGKLFHDLPKSLQDRLLNFKLIVAYVREAKGPELSRLFSRLQMGVQLNSPELRNAVQTPLRHAIDTKALVHPFFKNSRIPVARFKHQDYLAHAVSFCIHAGTRDLKAPQLMDDYVHINDTGILFPIINSSEEVLTFLEKVNERCGRKIRQKWIFVDLFYLLHNCKRGLNTIRVKDFAETYLEFDKRRLEYNSEPETLIEGVASSKDKDMYDYILAFKISGGEKKNLTQRQEALKRRFENVLGE